MGASTLDSEVTDSESAGAGDARLLLFVHADDVLVDSALVGVGCVEGNSDLIASVGDLDVLG